MKFFFNSFYQGLISVGENLQSTFLLVVRLFWGYQFYHSGLGKFFGIDEVISFFNELGIPFATFSSYSAASVECLGGVLLMLGLCSRLAAVPLMFVMGTAYATAHSEALLNIFNEPNKFIAQGPFTFFLACLIIFVFGPGRISCDAFIKRYLVKK